MPEEESVARLRAMACDQIDGMFLGDTDKKKNRQFYSIMAFGISDLQSHLRSLAAAHHRDLQCLQGMAQDLVAAKVPSHVRMNSRDRDEFVKDNWKLLRKDMKDRHQREAPQEVCKEVLAKALMGRK